MELMKKGEIYKLQWSTKYSTFKEIKSIEDLNREWIVEILKDEEEGKKVEMVVLMNNNDAPHIGYEYEYDRKYLEEVVVLTKL